MEIVINVAYGGENIAQEILVPQVRNIRKLIKNVFESYTQEGVKKMKIFLFFNGDLTSYYEKTGLYQPTYYQKKEEFIITICFDSIEWNNNQENNVKIFMLKFGDYLFEAGKILNKKLIKNKINFDIDSYNSHVNNILN